MTDCVKMVVLEKKNRRMIRESRLREEGIRKKEKNGRKAHK